MSISHADCPQSQPLTSIPLIVILVGAFALRLGVRASLGGDDFWQNGYTLFYDLALNLSSGKGLCSDYWGWKCAHRPPVYPFFLVLTQIGGKSHWPIIILQSAIGTGTVACSYLIGKELFDRTTGTVAALITAFYPYYVMHDTALQETVGK